MTTDPMRAALECALDHIEHMAKWIGQHQHGYSFESLGEDMPGMRAALSIPPTPTRAEIDDAPVNLVCSNKPRPRVQHGAKGHAGWDRDPFHIAKSGMSTLCGADCSEWLRLDPRPLSKALDDPGLCSRCAAKARHLPRPDIDEKMLRGLLAHEQFKRGGGGSTAIREGHDIPIYVGVAIAAMRRLASSPSAGEGE